MKTFKVLILILIASTLAACSGGLGDVYEKLSIELGPVTVLNPVAEAGDGTVTLRWEHNPRSESAEYSGIRVVWGNYPHDGNTTYRPLLEKTASEDLIPGLTNGNAYWFKVEYYMNGNPDEVVSGREVVFTPAIYVKQGVTPAVGATSGSSWENAFADLGNALDEAAARYTISSEMQHIWVASGFYYPSDSGDTTFTVSCPVWIKGSMAGNETADDSTSGIPAERINRWYGSGPTMLSGILFDGNGVPTSLNAAHVMTITGGGTVHLETLGIQEGGDGQLGNGGGIYAENATDLFLRMADCRVTDNAANGNGGGVYIRSAGASAWLEAVATQFDGNAATLHGGGVYLETPGNVASRFVRCKFVKNKAETVFGAAVYSQGHIDQIVSCVFASNECGSNGGALYLYNPGGGNKTVSIRSSTFYDNTALRGGAVYFHGVPGSTYSLDIFNTIMTRCTALNVGGGAFVYAQNDAELRYVGYIATGTYEQNFSDDNLYVIPGDKPLYWNFILTAESISFDANHRPLDDNCYRNQGAIAHDFLADPDGNITLYDSNYNWPYDRFDVNGGMRIRGSSIDIGAVEYQE